LNLHWRPQTHQAQSLAISAQFIQSMRLLQFGRQELQAYINEQCETNPLLEVLEASDAQDEPDAQSSRSENANSVQAESVRSRQEPSALAGSASRTASQHRHEDFRAVQDTVAAETSLRDHLRRQMGSGFRDKKDAKVAVEIIESLDDDGYLRRPLELIAEAVGESEERVRSVLAKIQRMDPSGVGARDLSECLRLQLAESGSLDPVTGALLKNLHLLADHDYTSLARLCETSVEDIVARAKALRSLNPRPGRQFDCDKTVPAIPDVTAHVRDDGALVTALNSDTLPRVLVNHQYYSEIMGHCRGKTEAKFVADCMRGANWLVHNLEHRSETILKVATEIVSIQREFLVDRGENLKPLTLKQISDAAGIHQSTVSRAVSNKYIAAPRGLFELKSLFTGAIPTKDGTESLSSDSVRRNIREMIDNETSACVLSDNRIVKQLRNKGIDIARRTVTKYRESLHIPSSLQRRRRMLAIAGVKGVQTGVSAQSAVSRGITAIGGRCIHLSSERAQGRST
jgi:RNA polymerase sigma-54 factor